MPSLFLSRSVSVELRPFCTNLVGRCLDRLDLDCFPFLGFSLVKEERRLKTELFLVVVSWFLMHL
jgi:hypothetical protein